MPHHQLVLLPSQAWLVRVARPTDSRQARHFAGSSDDRELKTPPVSGNSRGNSAGYRWLANMPGNIAMTGHRPHWYLEKRLPCFDLKPASLQMQLDMAQT
jgi:hypothetical protein